MPQLMYYNYNSTEYQFDAVEHGPNNSLILYYTDYSGDMYGQLEELFVISAADCVSTTNVHFNRQEFALLPPRKFCTTCLAYRFVYTGFEPDEHASVVRQWRKKCAEYFERATLLDILDAHDEPYDPEDIDGLADYEECQDYSRAAHLLPHTTDDVPRSLFADD